MSLLLSPGLAFLLKAIILGLGTAISAVLWSRWDMRRATIKGIVALRTQEEAVRRITGEQ